MFFLGSIILACLLTFVVYFRIVRKLTNKKRWRVLWIFVTVLFSSSLAWAFKGPQLFAPSDWPFIFVILGYYFMVVAGLFMCFVILRDILLTPVWLMDFVKKCKKGKRESGEASKEVAQTDEESEEQKVTKTGDSAAVSRRDFLVRGSSWAVLGATAVCTGPAIDVAKNGRVVRTTEIFYGAECPFRVPDGLRIVHLSDIHVGNTITREDIAKMVEETNALEPDIIVITGDIADGMPELVGPDLEPMRAFKSTYGAYYVTGNHEHMWDGRGWCEVVAGLGIHVLNNEHRMLEIRGVQSDPSADFGGMKIAVAGASDYRGDRRDRAWFSDPKSALSGIPSDIFKIMLVHQPNSVDSSFQHGANLVLLGHTHGGQFWPFCYIVNSMHKYARGFYDVAPHQKAYVSCGTGYWGPPLRLGVPPEICLHIIRKSQK